MPLKNSPKASTSPVTPASTETLLRLSFMSRPEIFFKCLLVVTIFKPHSYDIPGLDYCHCQDCGKWIVTSAGLRFLEKELVKANKRHYESDRAKKKAIERIQEQISQERRNRQQCSVQDKPLELVTIPTQEVAFCCA